MSLSPTLVVKAWHTVDLPTPPRVLANLWPSPNPVVARCPCVDTGWVRQGTNGIRPPIRVTASPKRPEAAMCSASGKWRLQRPRLPKVNGRD